MKKKQKKPNKVKIASKRSKVKNASLKKNYNSKIRQEYIDLDYLDKLNDTKKNCVLPDGTKVTELEYMAIFMKEWNSGGVSKQSEAHKNKLHRTAEEVKSCTDRTNARNRDQYGIAKATRFVHQVDPESVKDFIERKQYNSKNYVEDAFIDVLDNPKNLKNSTRNRKKQSN